MNQLKSSLIIALMAVFVFFTNCSKNQEAPLADNCKNEYQEPIFQLNDLKEIEDPTLDEADELNKIKLRHPDKHSGMSPCEKQLTGDTKNQDSMDKDKDRKDDKGGNDKGKDTMDGKNGKGKDDKKGNDGKDTDKNKDKETKGRYGKEKPNSDPNDLPFILKELNLTERQQAAVKGFMKEYCDCISTHLKRAKGINKFHLDRANITYEELLKAYKSGKITKVEFHEKLKALNNRTKEDIRKDNDKRTEMEIMKKCEASLFRNISSVLDNTQQDKFHRWVKNHK